MGKVKGKRNTESPVTQLIKGGKNRTNNSECILKMKKCQEKRKLLTEGKLNRKGTYLKKIELIKKKNNWGRKKQTLQNF